MQLATFSKGIAKTPYLLELLDARGIVLSPSAHQAADIDLVIGWGRNPTPSELKNLRNAMIFPMPLSKMDFYAQSD